MSNVIRAFPAASVAIFGIWQGYLFLESHWEDIFALLVLAIAMGSTLSVMIGRFFIGAGR